MPTGCVVYVCLVTAPLFCRLVNVPVCQLARELSRVAHLVPREKRTGGAKAKEVTSGVFGTVAKCIKNLNPKEDPTLLMDVMAELKKVDGENQCCRQFL